MAKGANDPQYKVRGTVAIGSLKVLQAHGLNTVDGIALSGALLKVLSDEKSLRSVMEAIFVDDFSQMEVENIDLKKVSAGVRDFLAGLVNPS